MKMKFTIAAFAAASLFAQDQVRIVTDGRAKPLTVDIIGSSGMAIGGRSVKGLPYSAEAVTETSQTLPDGNRISRKTTSAVYRDSQGRTRNEMAMPAVGPWASGKGEKIVNIFDPVTKISIMLHPDKTANKHEMPSMEGMNWTETTNSTGHARTMIFSKRVEGPKEAGQKTLVTEDVVIERVLGAEGPQAGGRFHAIPDIPLGAMARTSAAGKQTFRKESLGKKMIEGVEAEGTKTISTIPAGEIGNERDIEIVDETWFSKEIEEAVKQYM